MTESIKSKLIISLFFLLFTVVASQELNGELSGLTGVKNNGSDNSPVTFGIRYIPTFYLKTPITEKNLIDFEIAGNFSASHQVITSTNINDESVFEAYRIWMRYSTNRFESRIGLQKINFGPAKLLRSLMWFDRLDPQDPLQLAEGVYGLRLRYDFQNNANIWLWGLYGNNNLKGMEFIPTKENSPEYGGRFQYPVGNGEMAITTHNRTIEITDKTVSERRIALDGVWDIGVGAFFESALIKTDVKSSNQNWQSFLTLGMDYTFGIGNGLTVLGEHFLFTIDEAPFGRAVKKELSGVMLLYPMGIMDQLTAFSFYNWDDSQSYYYLSWQRTYDQWIIHVSGYQNTKKIMTSNQSRENQGNQGIQLMIIFNH